jgi:hypothetical protein
MNKLQIAEQLRRVLELYAQTLPEDKALEVSAVFPPYAIGRSYTVGEMFTYGVNGVGDAQLYKVVQDHVSSEEWAPDTVPSLYTPIGLADNGYPIWSQPTGAHDAYNIGDIVEYNGTLYKSLINGNVYSPEAYPAGWEVVNAVS